MIVSLGPERALEAMRKALAMGADRTVLVTDEGALGSDLVATSRILAAALEREGAELVLFGQQAGDSDGAVLWAAVADRLGRPLISQVAELTHEDGKLRGKRQTEYGYDVIEAPLPAVVAVSDAINEPRYPSLKGIMGAKKKPQETLSLADLGVRRGGGRRGGLAHGGLRAPRAAGARRHRQDRRRRVRGREDPRLPAREEGSVKPLVFLEHHERRPAEGLARRAREGGLARRRASRRRRSAPGSVRSRRRGREVRRRRVLRLRRPTPRRPAPAASRRRARAAHGRRGLRHVLFAASVLAADVAGGLSARLDAGLNWDLVDLVDEDGRLVGKRPALQDSVYVDVGWTSEPRLALIRSGTFDPAENGAGADVTPAPAEFEDFSLRRPCSSRPTRRARGRRSRRPR